MKLTMHTRKGGNSGRQVYIRIPPDFPVMKLFQAGFSIDGNSAFLETWYDMDRDTWCTDSMGDTKSLSAQLNAIHLKFINFFQNEGFEVDFD